MFGETLHYTDERTAASPEVLMRELSAHLAASGISDAAVTPVRPTIEDAFMALMGSPEDAVAAA